MVENSVVVEHLTELVVVIVALMGAGLKIDRPFLLARLGTAWRLLGITMPLTIGAAVLLGWWVLGLHIATAVLLGAIIAPTDPGFWRRTSRPARRSPRWRRNRTSSRNTPCGSP